MEIEKIISELSFKAVRSSGAGGQNVNKVSSKVVLSFDLKNSQALTEEEKQKWIIENKKASENAIHITNESEKPAALLLKSYLDKSFLNSFLIELGNKKNEKSAIINLEITNVEEDMIELTTYPKREIIYINFEYKGIPEDLPIEYIRIRSEPGKDGETKQKKIKPLESYK